MSQATPRIIATYTHGGAINALAFSPDGQRMATASDDKTVQVHAVADGSLVKTFTADVSMQRVVFAPDSSLVAASGFQSQPGAPSLGRIVVFEAATGVLKWKAAQFAKCAFSPDGSRILLLSGAKTVQMCDAHTGVQQWGFNIADVNGQVIFDAALSFDGATVAVALNGVNHAPQTALIVLLDASSGTLLRRITRPADVRAVSFSANRRLLAFGANTEIGLIDPASEMLRVLPNPWDPNITNPDSDRLVSSIALSPDNGLIGVVSVTVGTMNLQNIYLITADTFDVRQTLLTKTQVFAFSPDSRWALSAENNADVRVWDVATGIEQFKLLQGAQNVNAAAFGPTGLAAAVAAGNTATLLELPTPERFKFSHDGPVSAVRFNADGSRVLTGSQDSTARVFDTTSGTQQARLTHGGAVNSVVWVPANSLAATASADHEARIFDTATASERAHVAHGAAVNAVAVSADGQRLASAGDDAVVHLADVGTGSSLRSFDHNGPVHAVTFSPDSTRLASGSDDGTALLFNTATGANLMTFPHGGPVLALAFSPDGTRLATGCADNTARVFTVANGSLQFSVACGGPVHAVVFSPDGSQLAVGSDDTSARIVRADTGAELHRFTHGGAVQALAYQPAGKLLVTGSADATARVFDTGTGTQLRSFTHDGAVHAVSVDPAGTTLATASEDKTARLYPLPG